ncbi:MAG: glycoside-pentoside-hexuronide (GPH):cation symporter [Candidatus Marinimicrobia bacterium]|nr:glycoside-pentoside-hexuronide (GPH):cation symporter [Candidatus Neomarinimicrobiota bacterium]
MNTRNITNNDQAMKKLPLGLKLGYGVGEIGINIFIVTTGMFLLYYMTNVLKINPALAGTALIFAKLWDVVSDPLMGKISDSTKSKHGRRRPYLLYGAVPFGLTFLILFMAPPFDSETTKTIYVVLLYALGCTAFTVVAVPFSSMVAEMSADYNERMSITAFRMSLASIGALIAGGVAMPLVNMGGGGEQGFIVMAKVFSAVMIFSSLICFFATKRAPRLAASSDVLPVRQQIRIALKNTPFFMLMLSYLLQSLAAGVLMAGFVYYVRYVMGQSEDAMGIVFPIFLITGIVFIPIWNKIGKKLGKIKAYTLGLIILSVMQFSLFFTGPDFMTLFYIQIFLLGIGFSAFQLFPFSMLPDTMEYDQLNSGMRREGIFSGMWASGQKTAYSLGPAIVGIFLGLFHFNEQLGDHQPESVAFGIRLAFCIFPALMFLLSFIPFSKYDLTEARFEEIKQQIAMKD